MEDLGVKSIKKIEENDSSGKKRRAKLKVSLEQRSPSRNESSPKSQKSLKSSPKHTNMSGQEVGSKTKLGRSDSKRSIMTVFFEWYDKHPKAENGLLPKSGANTPFSHQLSQQEMKTTDFKSKKFRSQFTLPGSKALFGRKLSSL